MTRAAGKPAVLWPSDSLADLLESSGNPIPRTSTPHPGMSQLSQDMTTSRCIRVVIATMSNARSISLITVGLVQFQVVGLVLILAVTLFMTQTGLSVCRDSMS